ncbi:hypothetical protein [Lacibacter sp. H407]|uniref:hypothetical protein n=1 Tax=Lacibacter sp. H407 TaxID=3133423 RepID=UPI0030BFC03A
MIPPKQIVFVTTSSLATNPRLVKEVELAVSLGYSVVVVAFSFENWSRPLNDRLKKRFGDAVKLVEISADRKPFIPWLISTVTQIVCKGLVWLGVRTKPILSQALQKRTILLLYVLRRLQGKADLVVAHNPGSFYPVQYYAQKHHIPFGVDVEDYHPGEYTDERSRQRMKELIQATLPYASYITTAAPLILKEVQKDCNGSLKQIATVLNYFEAAEFVAPVAVSEHRFRFVWFSQHIAAGRGLEQLLRAIGSFANEAELHLYGHLDGAFFHSHIQHVVNVVVHKPLAQYELHALLGSYDVGVALEDAASNENRDLCITNKLLAYYQAGLFLFASNTKAQIDFLSQNPGHGIITQLSTEVLEKGIRQLINCKKEIRQQALTRFMNASSFSSDLELMYVSNQWMRVLSSNQYLTEPDSPNAL